MLRENKANAISMTRLATLPCALTWRFLELHRIINSRARRTLAFIGNSYCAKRSGYGRKRMYVNSALIKSKTARAKR